MQRYRSTAVFSAYTGENIDCLQLSLCLSQFMVSVWRVLILFLKGQMTLNAEAGWRMRASRKHWRKWAPVMTDGSQVTDFRCKSSSMKHQKHSLQPVNAASEWLLKEKPNRIRSYERWWSLKRYQNIRATEGPPNISHGPLRSSNKSFYRLELFN